ncbi:OmpA family protein [Alcanivorax sp. ZXX171]|nr:OmpA family protein [Alcanivorax sp. ZXX171]
MYGLNHTVVWTLGLALLVTVQSTAAAPATYPDGHGGEVTLPLGDLSFADAVGLYAPGDPAPRASATEAEAALGTPDFSKREKAGYVSLGCAGELILKFEDNALIDVAGPDLYVFEIGPDVEPTGLAVSSDGEQWVRVGRISGGQSEIDLAPYVSSATSFRYVRLVDLKHSCGGRTPGADIDTVAAIGSAQHIVLDSSVLFDSGAYALKIAAFEAIESALVDIGDRSIASVVVAGHTDAVGDAESNKGLSRKRARAVADYLLEQAGFDAKRVLVEARGESQPVASNETVEGRAKNRRVELTMRSPRGDAGEAAANIEILGLWETDHVGTVEMRRVDGKVNGEYTSDGGVLLGNFSGDTVFEGYWVENNSGRTCDSEKVGSKHWGPIKIDFKSPARDMFTAQWRYCGEEEWRGQWQTRKRLL